MWIQPSLITKTNKKKILLFGARGAVLFKPPTVFHFDRNFLIPANVSSLSVPYKILTKGLIRGFKKSIRFVGVGYRAQVDKNILILSLGFSYKLHIKIPDTIFVTIKKGVSLKLVSTNFEQLTQFAAKLRAFKKPNKYSGKGARYKTELLALKKRKNRL